MPKYLSPEEWAQRSIDTLTHLQASIARKRVNNNNNSLHTQERAVATCIAVISKYFLGGPTEINSHELVDAAPKTPRDERDKRFAAIWMSFSVEERGEIMDWFHTHRPEWLRHNGQVFVGDPELFLAAGEMLGFKSNLNSDELSTDNVPDRHTS